MKKSLVLLQVLILNGLSLFPAMVSADTNQKITHVVIVWLKQPGNEAQRTAFIKASQRLGNFPGIINRHVGVVLPSQRGVVDDTFDVAVSVTMKNKAAMRAYLSNPKHQKILNEKIKPLVNRVVAYDFVSQ